MFFFVTFSFFSVFAWTGFSEANFFYFNCYGASQAKIPDIEKCLDVVATLQAKKGTGEVRFQCEFHNFCLWFTIWVKDSLYLYLWGKSKEN